MSINRLNENIKFSKYGNVFKAKNLHDKYISFCELDKGKYYATLDLTGLIRANTSDKLINQTEESFDYIISKIVSNDNYKIYINNILILLNSDKLLKDEKQVMILVGIYNNIFDETIVHEDINNLQKLDSGNRSFEQLSIFCNYFNQSTRPYYYKKKSILKKVYNLLNEMMEENV